MPIRKDDQGRWHAEVCVSRRRLHRTLPPGSTAGDAKLVEAELTKALHAKRLKPTIPGDPLLTVLLADYSERHALYLRSTDTAQHHAARLGKFAEGRRASETREVAAEATENLTARGYAPATINRSLGALSKSLADAWQRGETPVDYSSLVRRLPENNQRTTYLDMKQVKRLADAASEPVRAAIWIALLTGCRRGEVCKIAAEDIGRDTIRLPAGNTKTLRYREVPIVPALRPWLKHLPLPIGFEGVKSGFRRARERVGMEHVHFHDLRHSCATIMLRLGVDLHVVREILGHSSVKVTERYAHVMVKPQREALRKLGDLHRDLHQKGKRPRRAA